MAHVKLEIKPDPDAMDFKPSPGAFDDEDVYEDTGDLEFNTNPAHNVMYLAKVPLYLYEAWSKLDDDAEIEIGTIRCSQQTMPDGTTKDNMAMLLREIGQHQLVPKEYALEITNKKVDNTFVFTEQDLPGYKSRSKQKFDLASANMPSRLQKARNDKGPEKKFDPTKRFTPYQRKAIPKRTILQGKVTQEINCKAVDNPESVKFLTRRTAEAMKPKVGTMFIKDDKGITSKNFILPGTTAASNGFSNFIKTKKSTAAAKPQQQKFARIPQNQLLDLIFKCFKEFKYWSMKSLRARLQQPEAYLKETLETCAVLAKSGRFASHWSLNQDYLAMHQASNDESAPMAEDGGAEDSDMADADDDDEDVKFEDVA